MKKLSLFVSAFALCVSVSNVSADCGTRPSCSDLGYDDIVSQCPKSSNLEDIALKCPFDMSKGKCVYDAAIGQISYFPVAVSEQTGWLRCDGRKVKSSQYPDLYKVIGTQFGGSSSEFYLPDYRGFFLRVYGTPNSNYGEIGNTDVTTPQKESLPNLMGRFGINDSSKADTVLFTRTYDDRPLDRVGKGDAANNSMRFDASKYNSVYGRSESVTPVNMAAYVYIYAGKIAQ